MPPVSVPNSMATIVPGSTLPREVVKAFRPDLTQYADFYRDVHENPEVAAMEKETAGKVAAHLTRLGLQSTRASVATVSSVSSGTARGRQS